MTLNLNPVMSIIANVPAAIASTVRLNIIPQGIVDDMVFLDRSLSRGSPAGKLLSDRRRDVFVSCVWRIV